MSEKYKIRDQSRLYFITFSVIGWIDVFTRKQYRDTLIESLKFCQQQKGLLVSAWCIMSNHVHLIVGSDGSNKIEDIIRDFKKFTSVQICRQIEQNDRERRKDWLLKLLLEAGSRSEKHSKYQFWQNSYHPVELSTNVMIDQRLNYLHNNPVKAGIVDRAEDYVYSSAKDYYTKGAGLIQLYFIN